MSKPRIVVTGKNGQLGWELQRASPQLSEFEFIFIDSDELNLGDLASIPVFFEKYKPAYFIGGAAYTLVDKAETDKETAYRVNAEAPAAIAAECAKYNCTMVQISTDYVFNGNGTEPYKATAAVEPVNYYGYTKAEGEKLALRNNPKTIVIRTSWLYSSHGNNFVKTMLRLMNERPELRVVNDQVGSPTYAADLANAILQIVGRLEKGASHQSIYQFSNSGVISWFDFATAIRDIAGLSCNVLPQPSSAYPTPAKRPSYSVMDTSDINRDFGVELKPWKESLVACMQLLDAYKGQ